MAINNTVKSPFNIASGIKLNSAGQVAQPSNATVAGLMTSSLKKPTTSYNSAPATNTAVVQPQSGSGGMSIPQYQAAIAAKSQPQYQAGANQSLGGTQQTGGVKGLLPSPPTYSGLVGGLAGMGQQPNQKAQDYTSQAAKYGAGSIPIAQQAQDISLKFGQDINRIGQEGAAFRAGQLTTGTSPVASGNAAITAQTTAAMQQAAATGQQAALAGLGYGLQGQQQAASAADAAATQAYAGSGQQIDALGSAAGYSAPSGTYPFVFDPLSGQFNQSTGGGAGGILSPQSAAQAVMSGSMTYDQAKASLGYLGGTGNAQLDSAITGSGGNPLQLQAQGNAQQSNIGTQQSAQTEIARAGLQQATDAYVQMNSASAFASQQSSAVDNILTKTGLNNISSTDYNKVLNNLQSRFSTEDYASLRTALQEAQFAYSNLLSTGGSTPTTNDQRALSTLDINQSARVIKASIAELENAVARRLQAQYGAMQTYQTNLNGSTAGGSTGGGYTGTGGGGLYDF